MKMILDEDGTLLGIDAEEETCKNCGAKKGVIGTCSRIFNVGVEHCWHPIGSIPIDVGEE